MPNNKAELILSNTLTITLCFGIETTTCAEHLIHYSISVTAFRVRRHKPIKHPVKSTRH